MIRKNPELDEFIEHLNRHLDFANGDPRAAFTRLSREESEFVDLEISRCASDVRYYLNNYHVIKTKDEGVMIMTSMWDSQEIFLEAVLKDIRKRGKAKIITLKARQLGISTLCEALVFHKTIFTEACNTLVVAHEPGQADVLFTMSRLAYDSLPWWMRPEARYEAKGRYLEFDRKDPVERMRNPGLRSAIYVEAANKMSGVSVGKALRAAHLSELSAWRNPATLTENIFPAMSAKDELFFMESTARGRDGFWYPTWRDAWEGEIDWTPLYIEWFRVRKYSIPIPKGETFELTESEEKIRQKVLDDRGILITDAQFNWKRKTIAEFVSINGDEWKFYQEYTGTHWSESFQATGLCAFDKRRLQHILEVDVCPPLYYGEIDLEPVDGVWTYRPRLTPVERGEHVPAAEQRGARLRVWELPDRDERYYIGADIGRGVDGGDFSVAEVFCIGRGPEPDRQVAEWHGWISPTQFAWVIAALGMWYNKCEVSPEINDVGQLVINELRMTVDYPSIYRWKHFDKIKNSLTNFLGWQTTGKTKPLIIAKMNEAIDQKSVLIRSADLVEELFDFTSDYDGGPMSAESGHDDRVMAACIANFCAHDSDYGRVAMGRPREEGDDRDKGKDFYNTACYAPYDTEMVRSLNRAADAARAIPNDVSMWESIDSTGPGGEDFDWRSL